MNTEGLLLAFYDNEDNNILDKVHNITRVSDDDLKPNQNYGNNNYFVKDWSILNYTISLNVFGIPTSLFNYTLKEKYKDIDMDDVWITAYGNLKTFGSDIYKDQIIERKIIISIVRETLELEVTTYPLDTSALSLNSSYNCKKVENLI